MRVAIMQPTFLPWIGYFGLIDSVDTFVFLDHVDFAKRSWQQRNLIKTATGQQWVTVPVHASRGTPLNEVRIAGGTDKIIASLHHNYGDQEYIDWLKPDYEYLCAMNIALIQKFCDLLGITTPLVRSSGLRARGAKSELLANICHELGADEYISPFGSRDYMDESVFDCRVSYFGYRHPKYRQRHGEFLPYMSICDLVANEGDGSLDVIRSGYAAGSYPG